MMAEGKPVKRRSMVGWYDPRVLAHTAYKLVIANIFGRHSDTRLIEALASQPQNEFDYSAVQGDFWFDYAADIGDGWNPTYTVADAIARPDLTLDINGRPEKTEAGRVLIFGGDEVYPYPTETEYSVRTETPYRVAFAGRPHPDVFAIPGNHDWYDSLVAFSRTFCRPERGFAGCATRQTRSYFALKLPANWWLLAIDLQLGADLDEPQVQYFQKVASRMDDAARLIFCVPEPRWILEDAYPNHASYEELRARASSKRKSSSARRACSSRATCTSTSATRMRKESRRSPRAAAARSCTPRMLRRLMSCATDSCSKRRIPTRRPRAVSRGATSCSRPSIPKSGWLYAFLYAMSAWLASASLEAADVIDVKTALGATLNAAIRDPLNGMWLVSVVGAFIFFTDTHVRSWRILGGAFHALAHLAAAFAVGWLALAADGARLRSRLRQHRPAAVLRPRSPSCSAGRWARSSSESIYWSPSACSDVTGTKRFRRCASRISSSGCGCASTRPAGSRSSRSPSIACRGAGARRSAMARRRSRRTTRARPRRGSSTGSRFALNQGGRSVRDPTLNQATGRLRGECSGLRSSPCSRRDRRHRHSARCADGRWSPWSCRRSRPRGPDPRDRWTP